MSDHMVFQDCPAWQKEAIKSYWQQKVSRIERLLSRFPEDQRELRLTVTHKPKRYDLHAVLLLPTGSLVADASSPTDREAIDAVVGKLTGELRRHKELIRREHLYHKKQARREASRRVAAQLQPEVRPVDRQAFFNLLNPIVDRLRGHAQHELVVAELQGRIGREEVTVADLLDEVIVRAWAQRAQRNEAEPLDVWLARLLHEVLDEQIGDTQAIHSIYEQVGTDNSDAQEAAARASEGVPIWEEPSMVTLEDVLPSHQVEEPWQQLEAIDQMKWVLAQLGTVSAVQRRAFTLHLLDAWEPDEIAMIQRRSVEEVRRDIEAVRRMLRNRLGGELNIRPSSPAPGHHTE